MPDYIGYYPILVRSHYIQTHAREFVNSGGREVSVLCGSALWIFFYSLWLYSCYVFTREID
jgi:hypothetical protein